MAYVRVKIRVVRGCWKHSRALNVVRRLTASCCHPGHNNTHHTYTRAISQTYKHVHSGTHTDTHTYTHRHQTTNPKHTGTKTLLNTPTCTSHKGDGGIVSLFGRGAIEERLLLGRTLVLPWPKVRARDLGGIPRVVVFGAPTMHLLAH